MKQLGILITTAGFSNVIETHADSSTTYDRSMEIPFHVRFCLVDVYENPERGTHPVLDR